MADNPCAGCKKPMGYGEYTEVFGKEYHADCFVCSICSKPFPDGAYVDYNSTPAHGACASARDKAAGSSASSSSGVPKKALSDSEVCSACGKPFQGGDDVCKLQGDGGKALYFHEKCVVCADCGKPIGSTKYGMSHGKPVHVECMHHADVTQDKAAVSEFAEDDMCQRCNERIQGQRKTVPGFGHFHLTCFKCSKCNLGIRSDQKFCKDEKTQKPICQRCM